MQCIELFQRLDADGRGWELSSRTRDELDTIASGGRNASLHAKRTIILENLYGVDIDEGAVEICKLRLWLSMVTDLEGEPGEVEPLPNIDFNIRQGNALIGFTEVKEVVTDDGDVALSSFGGGIGTSIADMYEEVIRSIERHRDADTPTEATNARRRADSLIHAHCERLNEKLTERFSEAGIDEVTTDELEDHDPFHWVLEFAAEYASGGFDIAVGNPPWEQLQPSRDDFFPQYDPTFRVRMPDDKDQKQEELLEDPEIEQAWESHQHQMNRRADYYKSSSSYELQSPEIDGRTVPSKRELSGLFLERILDLVDSKGYVAQILPSRILTGTSGKDLRVHLLQNTQIRLLVGFENNGIFDNIDGRFNFAITIFRNSGTSPEIKSTFKQQSISILRDISNHLIPVPKELYYDFSPDVRIFPQIRYEEEVEVLKRLISHPSINDETVDGWQIRPYFELNRTTDRDRFVTDSDKGDYPVYGGRNINQFEPSPLLETGIEPPEFWSVDEEEDPSTSAKRRIREKNLRKLKKRVYEAFDGSGSQKSFVNDLLEDSRGEGLSESDVLLDSTEYRIVYRDITQATNERTVLASVIPPGIVCHDKLHTVRPYRIEPSEENLTQDNLHSAYVREFTDRELFAALGLLNSIAFDYLMRRKTQATIIMYKLKETQIPHLTEGDDYFGYISKRALRLNSFGSEFEEMRDRVGDIDVVTSKPERRTLQAEIDAAVFHAYGLERSGAQFILKDFHRVENPRMMTEEYFDLVLEKFDSLADEGPHP